MTSSIRFEFNPESCLTAAITAAPNCGLLTVERSPSMLPIGVRFAESIAIGLDIDCSIKALTVIFYLTTRNDGFVLDFEVLVVF